MPSLIVPSLPQAVDPGFRLLSVECSFNLEEPEYKRFKDGVPFEGTTLHVSIGRAVSLDGRALDFSGLIGLHDARGEAYHQGSTSDNPTLTGFSLHYSFALRANSRPTKREDDKWDRVSEIARDLVPVHAADVRYRLSLDEELAVPAVKLPIPLSETETRGFSQISGVRLVQVDAADPNRQLYSVIIDRYSKHITFDVSVSTEVRFDDLLLKSALERASTVAALAFEPVRRE